MFHSICSSSSQVPIRALLNPSQILHNALHGLCFSFKSFSMMMFVIYLSLWRTMCSDSLSFDASFGDFSFDICFFISFCFHSFFAIFMYRLFLLISHYWTRTDEAWWVGRGEAWKPRLILLGLSGSCIKRHANVPPCKLPAPLTTIYPNQLSSFPRQVHLSSVCHLRY